MEIVLPENPFTDEYLDQEVEFYGLKKPYKKNGVEVRLAEPMGRLDDYLNVNWRVGGPMVPILLVDGHLWMSLTYMEVQSMYVPIAMAGGEVGTAGLGLGYFVLKIAEDDAVESIDVYERDKRVVEFFVEMFEDRPGFEKINFIVGDVRKLMKKKYYDFVFMDVYDTLLPDAAATDIDLFINANDIQDYRFWGLEKVLLDSMIAEERPHVLMFEREYFKTWAQTPLEDDPDTVLSQLYCPATDPEYRCQVLLRLERVGEGEGPCYDME
jgi:hypothetical protein